MLYCAVIPVIKAIELLIVGRKEGCKVRVESIHSNLHVQLASCHLDYGLATTGHSPKSRAPFIPMKAAQKCMKPKSLDLQLRLFCISSTLPTQRVWTLETFDNRAGNFQFSPWLTWMRIQVFDGTALLDYPNVIGLNSLYYDNETSHFGSNLYINRYMNLQTLPSQC